MVTAMGGFEAATLLLRGFLSMIFGREGLIVWAWFLVGIFAASGFVKLRSPDRAAIAMVQFGVLRDPNPSLGRVLGLGETTLGASLACCASGLVPDAKWVVVIAALLLWAFAFLIGRSLLAGQRFPCFCFGEADSNLSAWTLVRTVGLAALASELGLRTVGDGVGQLSPGGSTAVLAASTALALLGCASLARETPALLRWSNHSPPQGRAERSVQI
jgi:hypothetical protein